MSPQKVSHLDDRHVVDRKDRIGKLDGTSYLFEPAKIAEFFDTIASGDYNKTR